MVKIIKDTNGLIFKYTPERFGTIDWIDHSLAEHDRVFIRKVFTFTKNDLIPSTISDDESSDEIRFFRLGTLEGEYYKISKDILDLKYDLRLHHEMEITRKTFVAERDISIFRKIDNLIDEPIIVGGKLGNAIPIEDFNLLIKNFPTSTELKHYTDSRITRVLRDYLGTMTDAEQKLNAFFERKKKLKQPIKQELIIDIETHKFQYVYDELVQMLKSSESYTEHDWQKQLIKILLLIFPKYIEAFEEVRVDDFYSKETEMVDRKIDYLLVDADGHVDIIEIKKPTDNDLMSKSTYRENHRPLSVLSGSVMQTEKYLFYLNKSGIQGEDRIYHKIKSKLPENLKIKITNPKAMLILGREHNLTPQQRFDFEFVRRQYSNVIDIITYDDLLRRVKNIIDMLEQQSEKQGH